MGSEDEGEDDEVPVGSNRKRSPTTRLQIDDEVDNFPPFEDPDGIGDEDGDEDDEDKDDFGLGKSLGALGDIEVPQKKSSQSARKRSRRESSDEDDDTPLEVPEPVWENDVIERWVEGEKKGCTCLQCSFVHRGAHKKKSKPI